MASVLLPNAGRYNLGALAQALGVPYPATHRALDDAHATRGVFLRLYQEAMELPLPLLAEIIRLSDAVSEDWNGYWPFRLVMRQRSREVVSPTSIQHTYSGPLFAEKTTRLAVPLPPAGEPKTTRPGGSLGADRTGWRFRQPFLAVRAPSAAGSHAAVHHHGAL